MTAVGIPTTRVSDSYVHMRLLGQVQYSQTQLLRAQLQISTGHAFELPSQAPQAAARVISLQRLLERKQQISANISTTQSYLSQSESAMSAASSVLANIKGLVSSVVGSTASSSDITAAITEVNEAVASLLSITNQQYRGRYLFSGTLTATAAFNTDDNGYIAYQGNNLHLSTYVDVNLLYSTNYTGDEVFGAISAAAKGTADLTPALSSSTRLSDLNGGHGISPGSFTIICSSSSAQVDISQCDTIGDVAAKIEELTFGGAALQVEVSPTGLVIACTTGDIMVRDVSGGTTAAELGIVRGTATARIEGTSLTPSLRGTTSLDDILGAKAQACVRSAAENANVLFTARSNGTQYNGYTITYVDDPGVTAGNETIEPIANGIRIHIDEGGTTAADVVKAVHNAYVARTIDFDAQVDPLDPVGTGSGLVAAGDSALSDYGSGRSFDKTSGLQILNGAETHIVTFEDCSTIEDLLNKLNVAGAGVIAEINAKGSGINICSNLSGCDFTIAENGGTTAADLGIATFTGNTRLSELNYGYGTFNDTDFEVGTDFTITRADGVTLDIDLHGLVDVQDVLDAINNHSANTGTCRLVAQLRDNGNGIQLVDNSFGQGSLTIAAANGSAAPVALGLLARDKTSGGPTSPGAAATATINFAGSGASLTFTARGAGTSCNGTQINIEDCGPGGTQELIYDDASEPPTMTFRVDYSTATANTMVSLLQANPTANARYQATVGVNGAVQDASATLQDGKAALLDGADPNPQEVAGTFTALLRIKAALESGETWDLERATAMLEASYSQITLVRAELGAKQISLESLTDRQSEEIIDLQTNMSDDYDVDMVEAISNYTACQVAYEAALKTTSLIFRLSLLDYL